MKILTISTSMLTRWRSHLLRLQMLLVKSFMINVNTNFEISVAAGTLNVRQTNIRKFFLYWFFFKKTKWISIFQKILITI